MKSLPLLNALLGCLLSSGAWAVGAAGVCATPGAEDPTKTTVTVTAQSVLNTYYAGSGTASGTSLTLGAVRDSSKPTVQADDLLLIIQMQDGSNTTFADSSSYGVLNASTVGQYEYAKVASVTGTSVTLSSTLIHSYFQNVTQRQTFQVVRVPQYVNLTLSSKVTAPAWDGSSGGVVALDVAGTLTVDSAGSVDVTGLGFRGGAGRQRSGGTSTGGARDSYAFLNTSAYNGTKGEGIAGTPFDVYSSISDSAASGADNYTGGSIGRGAPGNAGGGSNDGDPFTPAANASGNGDNGLNAGGGGGANAGAGGNGGRTWHNFGQNSTPFTRDSNAAANGEPFGGLGGKSFANSASAVIMGGGGGAGDGNNSSTSNAAANRELNLSGASGGGIVLVRSGKLAGSGNIKADGAKGQDLPDPATIPSQTDGGPGGGAGGSVVLLVKDPSTTTLSLSATGGAGGRSGYQYHGPGGGGGGGYILRSSGLTSSALVSGGVSGIDYANLNYADYSASAYGAAPGTDGVADLANPPLTSVITPTPGVLPGAQCPDLQVVKSSSVNYPQNGQAFSYTVTLNNLGYSKATGVTLDDVLPSGLSLNSAFNPNPVASQGSFSANIWNVGALDSNLSATLTFNVKLNTAANAALTNTATLTNLDQTDRDSTNDSSSKVIQPNPIKLEKTVQKVLPAPPGTVGNTLQVKPGDTLEYCITASSTLAIARDIQVRDPITLNQSFVTASITGVLNGAVEAATSGNVGTVTGTLLGVSSSASKTLCFRTQVN